MSKRLSLLIPFVLALCICALAQTVAFGAIVYVKCDAAGANNGSSWENAFTLLQSALDNAQSGNEIWVATGESAPAIRHHHYWRNRPGRDSGGDFNVGVGIALLGRTHGRYLLQIQRLVREWSPLTRSALAARVSL